MLTFTRSLGHRAAEFSMPPLGEQEKRYVLDVLKDAFGEVNQSLFIPQDNPEKLRDALMKASPYLASVGEQLREKLDQEYSVICVSRAWLDQLDIDTRAALLYALATIMGSPTATDQVDRKVVWDIKALGTGMKEGHVPTFSEHAYEADLHTDTQYYQSPERFMLLYFNEAAKCGGGESFCRDISCIEQELSKTDKGQWALDVLRREKVPFRIPMTFTSDGSQEAEEVTIAPILGDTPHVRYRTDTMNRGFELHPEMETKELREAIDIFTEELFRPEPLVSAFLENDTLLALNNHECLHGRTEFSDPERHVFRIRIEETLSSNAA